MIAQDLKKKNLVSESALDIINKSCVGIPKAVFTRYSKNFKKGTVSREKYPAELRQFAMTLQFYSSKAYEYVRKTFALSLPSQSAIRKWSSQIECSPGFSGPCFEAIKIKVNQAIGKGHKVFCSLMLDEMAIKKQIDVEVDSVWGYVNIGCGANTTDDAISATEALVLMVVCHNGSWKIPIGYFFIKSITGEEKANIVKEALIRLYDAGAEVTSVTCDGPSVHFAMMKELGCKVTNPNDLKTWFVHPRNSMKKVYVMFDICHMIKLLRNCLSTYKCFKDPEGNFISWDYFTKLNALQEVETLHAGNKLRKRHINWHQQKMKVKI